MKSEDGQERFVDAPGFLGAQVADKFAKAVTVDCSDLFDEHSSVFTSYFGLRAKGRRLGAARCRSDDNHRPGQELVGLDDDTVAIAVLLVSYSFGRTEPVNVTTEHASPP
jgi:hypothetical protein